MKAIRVALTVALVSWASDAIACGNGWGFVDSKALDVAIKNWAMTPRPIAGRSAWKGLYPFRFVRDPKGDYLLRETDGWRRSVGQRLVDIRDGAVFVRGAAVGTATTETLTIGAVTYAVRVRRVGQTPAPERFPRYALRITRDEAPIVDQEIVTHGCNAKAHSARSITRWLLLYAGWRELIWPADRRGAAR